jgi:hypothetical protein
MRDKRISPAPFHLAAFARKQIVVRESGRLPVDGIRPVPGTGLSGPDNRQKDPFFLELVVKIVKTQILSSSESGIFPGKKRAIFSHSAENRGKIPNRVGIEKRPSVVDSKVRRGERENNGKNLGKPNQSDRPGSGFPLAPGITKSGIALRPEPRKIHSRRSIRLYRCFPHTFSRSLDIKEREFH